MYGRLMESKATFQKNLSSYFSDRETIIRLDHEWNVMFHHIIEIFMGYMWFVGFRMLNP